MRAFLEKETRIYLEMNEEEARWLCDLLQNPVAPIVPNQTGYSFDEDEKSEKMRGGIYHALKVAISED